MHVGPLQPDEQGAARAFGPVVQDGLRRPGVASLRQVSEAAAAGGSLSRHAESHPELATVARGVASAQVHVDRSTSLEGEVIQLPHMEGRSSLGGTGEEGGSGTCHAAVPRGRCRPKDIGSAILRRSRPGGHQTAGCMTRCVRSETGSCESSQLSWGSRSASVTNSDAPRQMGRPARTRSGDRRICAGETGLSNSLKVDL